LRYEYIIIEKITFEVILPFFLLLLIFFFNTEVFSQEACSRVAIINYQEVLIDSNTSEKGEGLRFHLEKDPLAKSLLETYQKNSRIIWPSAIIGTAGTGLLLYGLLNSDAEDQRILLISGSATLLVNFLIARTMEVQNESNLNKSIEEYNKRNLPKIFFNPEETQGQINFNSFKIGLAKAWSF
jgi:hypothetical protein